MIGDSAVGSDVAVVSDDVVLRRAAGDANAAACGCVVFDGDVLARIRAAVAVGHDVDGGNSAGGADVIMLYQQAVDAAGFVNGDVGVSAILDDFAVQHGAIDVVFVHEAFAVVDSVAVIGGPISVDEVIVPLHGPAPAPHLHRSVIIGG